MDQKVNFLPVSSNLNWDEYFMFQAMMASFKSKDPNTKVGCVFVDDNNHQLSMGYNGQIAGIDETKIHGEIAGRSLSISKNMPTLCIRKPMPYFTPKQNSLIPVVM